LREPSVLAPGDRFILRQFSPVITIAGGTVVDTQPTRERRAAQIEARLTVLAGNDTSAKIALLVHEAAAGVSAADLASRVGIKPDRALQFARQPDVTVIDPPGWAASRAWMQRSRAELLKAVQNHHSQAPLSPGMSRQELRARLMPQAPPFVFDAVLAGVAELSVEGDRVRHRTHRVVLSDDEEQARRNIALAFEQAGLAVPSVPEVLANAGVDLARGQTILRMLLKDRVLIRISDELMFHRSAIANLKTLLASKKGESFTVSAFKDWTGISRKYAVPLLEFLDREHATTRKGDLRLVV
jgi:selenocysteine-specific elongation factor